MFYFNLKGSRPKMLTYSIQRWSPPKWLSDFIQFNKTALFTVLALVLLLVIGAHTNPSVSANTTNVQSVPLINQKGPNVADAVQKGGQDLQEAINNASNSNQITHSSGSSSDSGDDADQAVDSVLFGGRKDTLANGNLRIDRTARVSDVFKIEHRVGADILNILIYGGHWICMIAFIWGLFWTIFGWGRAGRAGGIAMLVGSLVVLALVTHVGSLFSWWLGYVQHVIGA